MPLFPLHIGLKGIRTPCMYVARMCLFDRANHHFLGNVMGFKPQSVLTNESEWIFDPKVSSALSLYCSQLA